MANFFISYSHIEQATAERYKRLLERLSPDSAVFLDSHSLYGGQDWWEEILNAIEQCDIFFYLLTDDSVRSEFCQTEFYFARQLGKPVITIQIRDYTELTGDLSGIQYINMSPGKDHAEAMASLGGAIQIQLAHKKIRPTSRQRPEKPRNIVETGRSADAPPVQTPDFVVPTISASRKFWLFQPVYFVPILAAFITGLCGLGQGILANMFNDDGNLPSPPTNATIQVNTSTPPTPVPTVISTLAPEQLALTPVTRNTDWTPYERDFDGVTMVLVPVGCFTMGSETGDEDEQPVNEQCLNQPFWIDKYEVTNAQYGSIGQCVNYSSEPNQPRNCVTWTDARDFCETRGGRLPTEAEWEYAARGPDGLVYPWGNAFLANAPIHNGNSTETAEVGRHPIGASWIGAMDMSGNIAEWTSSLYRSYPYRSENDRVSFTNSSRVLRGGSFTSDALSVTSTIRFRFSPDVQTIIGGFRCARDFEG